MKDYKGYGMLKVTRKDILLRDPQGNPIIVDRHPRTYKEAKEVIDRIISGSNQS